jgi:CHAD domain-containing protein
MTALKDGKAAVVQRPAEGQSLSDVIRQHQGRLAAVAGRVAETRAEDVHQGRVAARRLRSLLKTFGPLLDPRWCRRYRSDLKRFARTLADVREADVTRELLLGLARSDAGMAAMDLRRLSVAMERRRNDARRVLLRHLAEPRWRALTEALAARAGESPHWAREDAGLDEMLKLAERSFGKAMRRIRQHPKDAAALHELRLKLKHCRYALEAVVEVKPRAAARLLRGLRTAQESLGQHRDGTVALLWVTNNDAELGRRVATRLVELLKAREEKLYVESMQGCNGLLPAYSRWRAAIKPLLKT